MQPHIPFGIFFLQLALCIGALSLNKGISEVPPNSMGDYGRGLAAERFLLKGSRVLFYKPRAVIFKRPGGDITALTDFYALKPTNVRHVNEITETEIHGQVGKRTVVLTTGKRRSNGKRLFPQITITRFEPGKDSENNFYMMVFWYMGGYVDGPIET